MDRKILALLLLVGILMVPARSWANATQAGGVFLTIFPGAKATAMGAAFSAIADDATASYYNPGALGFFDHAEFSMIHAPWLRKLANDMYYEFGGFVYPIAGGNGVIGGHIIYLTLGQIDAYGEGNVYFGSFRPFDFAIDFAVGLKPKENLGVGAGVKFIYSFLAPGNIIREVLHEPGQGGSAMSFAVDAGVLYKPAITKLDTIRLSAVLTNIGPGLKYTENGEVDPLPRTLRLGIAYKREFAGVHSITISADINKVLVGITNDVRTKGMGYVVDEAFKHVGIEYGLMDIVFVRAGYFLDKEGKREGPTFGGGLKFKSFKFDIADDSKIYDFEESSNRRYALTYIKNF